MQQTVGETRQYSQSIPGDTIASASWAISPSGPTLSGQVNTLTTSTILVATPAAGNFVLTATLTGTSGQILKPAIEIQVVPALIPATV